MPPSLRFALRRLRRSSSFSVLAIAILAIGIGATTAMFSITRTVLLKPLAYRDPDRLVTILSRIPQFSKDVTTIPMNEQHYELWRDHARSIEEVGMMRPSTSILSGAGVAEQIGGVGVTANLFHVLGVNAKLGRTFRQGEDTDAHQGVIIVSYGFWQRKLGGRTDVINQPLFLSGKRFQIVGVMPASFPFPHGTQMSQVEALRDKIEYWKPLVFSKDDLSEPLGNENFLPIARLKPGVTVAQSLAELTSLEKVIAKRYPAPVQIDTMMRPLQANMARDVRLPLLILTTAVFAVLLIVCINLMNLMIVRAAAQQREWAIRLAVGGGIRDLLAGTLLESFLLSFAGAALGCIVSIWLLATVRLKAPVDLPRVDELRLDPVALLFALTLSVLTAFLFGLWPAWRASQVDPQEALQSSSRSASEGRKGRRTGNLLVAAEVALSTVLLLSAGLLLNSFVALLNVDPGLKVEHLLTARINLPTDRYKDDAQFLGFYNRLREAVNRMPGVQSSGLISDLPVTVNDNNNPAMAADRPPVPLQQQPITNGREASEDYFAAAGIPVKEGRAFQPRDGNTPEVMISKNLAERLWPGTSAIGRPLLMYGRKERYRVVGVVGAVKAQSLREEPSMMVYYPMWQNVDSGMALVVRTPAGLSSLTPAIRRAILQLEPQAAIPSMESMDEVIAKAVAPQRFQLILLSTFAIAALLLASLGIYGVLAYSTNRRTSEIGIRMALGARPGSILAAVLRTGMLPVLGGIGMGLAASLALSRVLQNLLFQVKALDPAMYLGTALVLCVVAIAACLIPAGRAARLNPVEALRHQ